MNIFDTNTPIREAGSELQDLLVYLAERYVDNPARPCCDGDTTLNDWIEAGLYSQEAGE